MFRSRKGQSHAQQVAAQRAPAYAPSPAPVMSPWARRALGLDNDGSPNLPRGARRRRLPRIAHGRTMTAHDPYCYQCRATTARASRPRNVGWDRAEDRILAAADPTCRTCGDPLRVTDDPRVGRCRQCILADRIADPYR